MDPALLGRKFKFYHGYQNLEIVHTVLGFCIVEAQIYCIHAGDGQGVQHTILTGSSIHDYILKYEKENPELQAGGLVREKPVEKS